MPRKRTILQSEFPYHISARCINKEWFRIPLNKVWVVMGNYLFFLRHAFGFRIHSFVLMDNHFHLIVSTPESNLSKGMNYFMRETSRVISRESGRINQTYGSPYHWCIVDSYSYFLNAYKYVYRNPVDAGMVSRCENYPYSTLYGILGMDHISIPLSEDMIIFNPTLQEREIEWLNFANKDDLIEVKKALRKTYFRFSNHSENNRPLRGETFVF